MTKEIFDTYVNAGWHLFPLYKTKKTEDQAKGKYATPNGWNDLTKTYKYKADTIYGGMPPEGVIVIDVDVKNGKDGMTSFERILKDFNVMLSPSTTTPSGGFHCYVRLAKPFLAKKLQENYPDIDFLVRGREWAMLGGQTVEGYGDYELDDIFGYNESKVDLTGLEERGDRTTTNSDYDEDDLFNKEMDMTDQMVDEFLTQIPKDLAYSDWVEVGMALYDRYQGNDEGRARWLAFVTASDKHTEGSTMGADKWDKGYLVPQGITYVRLRNMASEFSNTFKQDIKKATSQKAINKIIDKIAHTKNVKTRNKKDIDIRTDLSVELNTKLKELKKEDSTITVAQARTIVKDLVYIPTIEEAKADVKQNDISIYLHARAYTMQCKGLVVESLAKKQLEEHAKTLGISSKVFASACSIPTAISGVKAESDYLIPNTQLIGVLNSGMSYELPFLHIKINPIIGVEPTHDYDEGIISDFFDTIWQGKFIDIIKLVGLTIRFGEPKKNQLMLVTPTSFGKTAAMKHMGFNEIGMSLLLGAMQSEGIGGEVLNPIKKTGLMLINEVDTTIPKALKELENRIQVKEFGMGGGTRSIPLHFLIMTSTHKTAILKISDEVSERTMFMELKRGDSPYNLTKSPIFNKQRKNYTNVLRSHVIRLFKEYLYGEGHVEDDLLALQSRYHLNPSDDLDGILEDVVRTTHAEILRNIGVHYKGNWYVQRKTDIQDLIESLLSDHSDIDVGKYIQEVVDSVIDTTQRYKVQGKQQYRVKTDDMTVADEFEDLSVEFE